MNRRELFWDILYYWLTLLFTGITVVGLYIALHGNTLAQSLVLILGILLMITQTVKSIRSSRIK